MKINCSDADIEYIENFYSSDEARVLFKELGQNLAWRHDDIKLFGKVMKIPRLQAWYGDNNLSYRYSNMTLTAEPWAASLRALKAKVSDYCQHDFNAVLANLYRNQQDSVGWHSDDEPELGEMPTIASLSFGAEREFQLKHIVTKEKITISLAAGSLLIMKGETQDCWQHCLPKRTKAISPRINLTFRKICL
ncbi:alpha-ketoglutarate-dependent dioxygenase AlkB [Colwellia sp. BRX10-3]|uniref:alpha-ketoglutarate-dependent dioxygenase AlkB family protein n=1 Tax=Colwellia sp. BRX10-3 TaxID=2759844 RepID=UPI001C7127E8|nr:alpha-ketoglutarate-dependent dioxygenase AlkB [Colwellia sp. BRX10-3]